MRLRKTTLAFLGLLAVSTSIGAPALAQRGGTPAQQAESSRAAIALRERIATTDARITTAQRGGKITPARATAMHRQVAQTQSSMMRLSRRQGFVSAAELASYNHTLGAIDIELDGRGVERSYGNDMLPPESGPTHSYGNDALPSAEVTAFQKADARLKYRTARIDYDARGCAVYRGTAPDGRMRSKPLVAANGQPICIRR